MLQILVPGRDFFDEKTGCFGLTHDTTLQLEHSLLSISKWEARWHKPYLSDEPKTREECVDYIRCMTINSGVDPMIYNLLDDAFFRKVNDYIDEPMTATWFGKDDKPKTNPGVVTAEIIYYWMISMNIPFECQKWHINRLMTLIRVCGEKNAPKKKMSKEDLYAHHRKLNALHKSKHKGR